jgi:hypothetical protein
MPFSSGCIRTTGEHHGFRILIVADGVQLLFHMNFSSAVSPGQGQDPGLDVCHEAHESGVGRSGDADPGADLLPDFTFELVPVAVT